MKTFTYECCQSETLPDTIPAVLLKWARNRDYVEGFVIVENRKVVVRLDAPDNHIHNRACQALCDALDRAIVDSFC